MSLSNPTAKNPAAVFLQWKGGAEAFKENGQVRYEGGKLTYYDKELEQNVEMDLPFSFIVLDELATITGFHEPSQSGFWSNEVRVRDLATKELVVRRKDGIVARGVYSKIAEKIKAQGAKYSISCYIAFKDTDGELKIGNIKLAGAALNAWIEFKKKFDVEQCAVFITDEPKLDKKGTNHFFSPVFEGQNLTEATKKEAVALDRELQNYLYSYLSREPEVSGDDLEEVDDETDEGVEIQDYNPPTDSHQTTDEPEPKASGDDGKIPLKNVPF